jgi:ATP-dependent Lon protease
MEVIRIPGYTEDEKVNISQKYLIPKQSENNGLKTDEWKIEENVNRKIIRHYTRESGVRNLEREISKIARKTVKKIDGQEKTNNPIIDSDLPDYLGVEKFNYGEIEEQNRIGVVTGLAWTEVGGEILKIETVIMPGKGKMEITGMLGDVMQESIKAAKSYIRSKSLDYGIIPPIFDKKDFHVHVPEGATPKDGPSAGVGMVTSIVSAITEIPVDKNIAMTGEITLRGIVLPIGGLKEKLLAAHRAGIKKVLIPFENEKDLAEIPEIIKKNIEIVPVKNVDEVLKHALTKKLKRVEWVEVEKISKNKDDSSITSRH